MHTGPETAESDDRMARPGALAEIGEEAFAFARIGGRGEARAHSLPGIRRQRELGH